MKARHPHEPHRTATPLELFFDLVFVVAIAEASASLHHAVAAGHAADGVLGFVMVFFGIWWAWMNFTWFASAYDTDDVPYRVTVLVQMTGALIFTAGIGQLFDGTSIAVGVAGYVVMRLAMVAQWLRAARGDPSRRGTALRYAVGIVVVQLCWVVLAFLPAALLVRGFFSLVALELLVPLWAERSGRTPWHAHHIAERFGLMTIIVLGESVLAASTATQQALGAGQALGSLVAIIVGGLLTMYVMWWLYFDTPTHELLTSFGRTFAWSYGHYVVFAAAAGVGAGIALSVDQRIGAAPIGARIAGWAFAIPVALFLGMLWALHARAHPTDRAARFTHAGPLAALLVLATPFHRGTRPLDRRDPHAPARDETRGAPPAARTRASPRRVTPQETGLPGSLFSGHFSNQLRR